jgi:hypothetical protein
MDNHNVNKFDVSLDLFKNVVYSSFGARLLSAPTLHNFSLVIFNMKRAVEYQIKLEAVRQSTLTNFMRIVALLNTLYIKCFRTLISVSPSVPFCFRYCC